MSAGFASPARVLALNDAARRVDRRLFIFRNVAGRAALRAFLASRPPFLPIADALAGRGDALTIDDVTRASADAAYLAREHGHAVSLFVNPAQIESGEPYWFVLLYGLMDGLTRPSCDFGGRTFETRSQAGREALRAAIKAECRTLAEEALRAARVRDLANRWDVVLHVPPHLATLALSDLRALAAAGVALENHGWSHADHARLPADESAREIRRGREWLRRELRVPASYFAVPYGDVRPQAAVESVCDAWLTLNAAWPEGPAGPGTFNRAEPVLPAPPRRRPRRRTPRQDRGGLRRWLSRLRRRVTA